MFRVTIRGKFDTPALTDADRTALLADADAFRTAYTEAGTFTYDRSLSAFTFRCQLPAGDEDGEPEATRRALAALDAHGYPYQVLRVGVTDMRDIKIRRKRRQG
ncbi:hypothetical protein ACZ90_51735 [Streptomyces albus subsp. albus]|nr:hypothetical protein ACZ90_51735 [Streptomyces albus subsp. albus]